MRGLSYSGGFKVVVAMLVLDGPLVQYPSLWDYIVKVIVVLIGAIEIIGAGIIMVMGCPLVVRVTVTIWIRHAVAGEPFKKSSGTERTSPFPTTRSPLRCYGIA